MATFKRFLDKTQQTQPIERKVLAAPLVGLTSAANQPRRPAQSTPQGERYVGLKEWMDRNESQAKAQANKIADRVEGQGQSATQKVTDLQNEFKQAVDQGSVKYDPNVRNQPMGSGQYGIKRSGETTVDTLNRLSQQTYTGPTDITTHAGYDAAASEVEKAQQAANSTKNVNGLVREEFGKEGDYSTGQAKLDGFLTGAAGAQRFKELQDKYGNLSSLMGDTAQSSADYASQAQASSADAASRYGQDATKVVEEQKAAQEKAIKDEAEKLRKMDEENRRSSRNKQVRSLGYEEHANNHGMTLEEWIANGKQPPWGEGY